MTELELGAEAKAFSERNTEEQSDDPPVGTSIDDRLPSETGDPIYTPENLVRGQRSQGYISRDELTESALDVRLGIEETHYKIKPIASG